MARSKMVFYGTDQSKTNEHELTAYCNSNAEIYIEINDGDKTNQFNTGFICLDKATAVSLVRNLKREIGNLTKMEEDGGR